MILWLLLACSTPHPCQDLPAPGKRWSALEPPEGRACETLGTLQIVHDGDVATLTDHYVRHYLGKHWDVQRDGDLIRLIRHDNVRAEVRIHADGAHTVAHLRWTSPPSE